LIVAAIPAYNEEKTIAKVVVRTMKHVDKVVVIDDGSTDDTATIAEHLGAHIVKHEENLGYGAAIRSCFSAARDLNCDTLVILDGDGQHNGDDIPKLLAPIQAGEAEIVIGSRLVGTDVSEIPSYRRAGLRLINAATNRVAKQKVADTQSGFRAYSRKAVQRIRPYERGMGVTSEIDIRSGDAGLTIVDVPVGVAYQGLETSSQSPISHGLEILSAVLRIAGEKHPVALFGIPGLVSIIGGLGGWLWVANRFAQVQELPIGIALVSTILLIAGALALMTGMILYTIADMSRRLM
jgi:glycosyltransferase involved in cell wall biosynthesis